MKRSEMRDLIKQELLKTVGGDAAKYIAEDILHIIEEVGMLPPLLPGENWADVRDYGWESEDESN